MKTNHIVVKSNDKFKIEISDILNTLGLELIRHYKWVMFDMSPIGSWADMKLIEGITSKGSTINVIESDKFMELMEKIQTDWGVCLAFKSHEALSFKKVPKSNPEEKYKPQSDSAEIEIRSLDGSKLFVYSKDPTIVKKLKEAYENTSETY